MPEVTAPETVAPIAPAAATAVVKMQLCTTIIDVPAEQVERRKAEGWHVITARLPYVAPPAKDAEPGCC